MVEVWRNDDKILTHSGPNKYKGERLPRWKVGIYKDAWDGKTTDTDKRILYFDNIRIGNEKASYEEMDPKKIITKDGDLKYQKSNRSLLLTRLRTRH